jgi:hypothetical protein
MVFLRLLPSVHPLLLARTAFPAKHFLPGAVHAARVADLCDLRIYSARSLLQMLSQTAGDAGALAHVFTDFANLAMLHFSDSQLLRRLEVEAVH